MNYYFNFSTGLIDTMLLKSKHEHYFYPDCPRGYLFRPDVIGTSMVESSKAGEKGTRRRDWRKETIDTCIYNFLCAQDLVAESDMNKLYEHEFKSPFSKGYETALLLLKWISGIQGITKEWSVEITRDMLKEIEFDHMTPMDAKIILEKAFGNKPVLTKSTYDKGTYTVKIGPREMLAEDGPGRVNIRLNYPAVIENIKAHHDRLKQTKMDTANID